MKETDKKKPISTLPKGIWESTPPLKKKTPEDQSASTDLQGNGYSDQKKK